MGTNFYFKLKKCQHCERPAEEIHIGKSSAGWCFHLHVIPEKGINDLDDWKEWFNTKGSQIKDEYGRTITIEDMLSTITERSFPRSPQNSRTFDYEQNNAVEGPFGLVRSKVGGTCIGHGSGTWDLITGEFS